MINKIFTFLSIAFLGINLHANWYNIKDFGAQPGEGKINTVFIQKAIDSCSFNGGGTVYIPTGTFYTGTLDLKSNVNLYLEAGAVLKGSRNLNDYRQYQSFNHGASHYGIIYAEKAINISITGFGMLDGNDSVFFNWQKAKKIEWGGIQNTRQKENFRKITEGIGDGPVEPYERPRQMVIFSQCENVRVEGIQLLRAPFWTLHFADCNGVICSNLRIIGNMLVPNNDGIDITSCKNVLIANCDIRTGDDAIAITGYAHHFELPGYHNLRHESENIQIVNCHLESRSSGIRIGFEDQNNVRNIIIHNITITNSNRGIGIFARDSGSIQNVIVSNVIIETRLHTGDWWGNAEPIHISAVPKIAEGKTGKISNIIFRDIICKSEAGILLFATPNCEINNIQFFNMQLHIKSSAINDIAGGNFDLRGCGIPELSLFKHDIPAFYAQNIKNIELNDIKISWDTEQMMPFHTHAIHMKNCRKIKIKNFEGYSSPSNNKLKPINFENCQNIYFAPRK